MPIPWDKVILHGPQVLDVAKTLYGKWQSRPRPPEPEAAGTESLDIQLKTLRSRLKTLEEAGEKQAALAAELAEQTQALTVGVTAMKDEIERLQHKAAGAHAEIERHLHQTYDRLQQVENFHSSLNKKLTLALIVSITAIASSAAVLVALLQR